MPLLSDTLTFIRGSAPTALLRSAAVGGGAAPEPVVFFEPDSFATNTQINATKAYQFTVDEAGVQAHGGRVFLRSVVTATIRLYRVSDEVVLASKQVNSVIDTWVEGLFDEPVALDSGSDYLIAVFAGSPQPFYVDTSASGNFTGEAAAYLSFVRGLFGSGDSFPGGDVGNRVDGFVDILSSIS
jgi:hypothetical protein